MNVKPIVKHGASIFLGFALGMTAASVMHGRGFPFLPPPPPGVFLRHFARDFNLSAEQQQAAKLIFEEQRKKAEVAHSEIFPRFEKLRHETRDRVRALLTPEQQAKFDERLARHPVNPPRLPQPPPPPPF